MDDLIKAIERDRVVSWRTRYRRVTALLLDDVHLLSGRDRTQEELFWLYNQLAESGRQMVFTALLPPQELEGLDERLRTRLEAGLVVELPTPERDVREAMVARVLLEKVGEADPELAGYLASRPVENRAGTAGAGPAGARRRRRGTGAALGRRSPARCWRGAPPPRRDAPPLAGPVG